MTTVTGSYVSPLAHQGFRKSVVIPKKDFINDAIKTATHCYPRRLPVIPTYKATGSRQSRKYFESKLVQDIIKLTLDTKKFVVKSGGSPVNKLSGRRRCAPSPTPEAAQSMERKFINDAVVADRQRTRYIDTLLPKYDASQDRYCADYFSKPFIRVQLKQKKFREFPVTTWRTRPFTPLLPKVHRKDLSELTYGVQKPRVIRESYNLAQYDRMLYQKPKRYGSVSDLESTYLGKSPRDSNARNNLRASESNLSRSKLGQAQSYSNVSRTRKPNVNKQSRHLVKPTPPVEKLRQREKRFVNDAIRSEKLRTKYKDMIPPYDATDDRHTATGNIEPVDGST